MGRRGFRAILKARVWPPTKCLECGQGELGCQGLRCSWWVLGKGRCSRTGGSVMGALSGVDVLLIDALGV